MAARGTGKKNEALLKEFKRKNGGQAIEAPKETRGRKLIENRPERYAAKRTLPGEERYIITADTKQIMSMKHIALKKGITIKEAFAEAMGKYLNK